MSRSWLYKLLARYRGEGWVGVEAHSRRPHRSPTQITDRFEDEIVALRKRFTDQGFDAGAVTIHYHLAKRHQRAPSVSTIWRVLKARGFVTPQPHKRPRSSYVRFEAELPNECWQIDLTHVELADHTVVEILNAVDDHSRLCIASQALSVFGAADTVRVFHQTAAQWGYPASVLTDNGAIFTATYRNGIGAFESELCALGIAFHPHLPAIAVDGYRLRRDTIDRDGKLTVRHAGRLHHIGMERRYARQPVAMLIAGRDIRILDNTGQLLRHLTLDPTRDYQPQQ